MAPTTPTSTTTRARRLRRCSLVVGTLGLLSVLLGLTGTVGRAGAQTGPITYSGFTVAAASDGEGVTFGAPSKPPYPVAAGQMAHTEASLTQGPTGYALASTFWPGPLAANAGSLAVLLTGAPPEASQANYAGRAEASSPGGNPDAELAGMRAHSGDDLVEATAAVTGVTNDPGLSSGSINTLSRSVVDDDGRLVALGQSIITDVVIGENVIEIDSVTTRATAATDGLAAEASGLTTVSGLVIAGQEASVDEEGVRFSDPATQAVGDQILSNMGIEMWVAQPTTNVGTNAASYRSGSLVVVWEIPQSGGYTWVYTIGGSSATARGNRATAPPGRPAITPPVSTFGAPALPPTTTIDRAAPASPIRPGTGVAATPPAATDPALTDAPANPSGDLVAALPVGFHRQLSWWPYVLGFLASIAAAAGLRRARLLLLDAHPVPVTSCPLGK